MWFVGFSAISICKCTMFWGIILPRAVWAQFQVKDWVPCFLRKDDSLCCLLLDHVIVFFFFSVNLSLLSPSVNVSGSYVLTILTAEDILTWRGTIPPKQYFLHAFCIQHQCYCSYSKSNKCHEEEKVACFRLLQNHYVKDMIIGSWIQEGEIEILRHQAYQIFLPPSTHHTLTLAVCANFFPFLFSFIV